MKQVEEEGCQAKDEGGEEKEGGAQKGSITLYEVGMTLKGEIGASSRGLELRVGQRQVTRVLSLEFRLVRDQCQVVGCRDILALGGIKPRGFIHVEVWCKFIGSNYGYCQEDKVGIRVKRIEGGQCKGEVDGQVLVLGKGDGLRARVRCQEPRVQGLERLGSCTRVLGYLSQG